MSRFRDELRYAMLGDKVRSAEKDMEIIRRMMMMNSASSKDNTYNEHDDGDPPPPPAPREFRVTGSTTNLPVIASKVRPPSAIIAGSPLQKKRGIMAVGVGRARSVGRPIVTLSETLSCTVEQPTDRALARSMAGSPSSSSPTKKAQKGIKKKFFAPQPPATSTRSPTEGGRSPTTFRQHQLQSTVLSTLDDAKAYFSDILDEMFQQESEDQMESTFTGETVLRLMNMVNSHCGLSVDATARTTAELEERIALLYSHLEQQRDVYEIQLTTVEQLQAERDTLRAEQVRARAALATRNALRDDEGVQTDPWEDIMLSPRSTRSGGTLECAIQTDDVESAEVAVGTDADAPHPPVLSAHPFKSPVPRLVRPPPPSADAPVKIVEKVVIRERIKRAPCHKCRALALDTTAYDLPDLVTDIAVAYDKNIQTDYKPDTPSTSYFPIVSATTPMPSPQDDSMSSCSMGATERAREALRSLLDTSRDLTVQRRLGQAIVELGPEVKYRKRGRSLLSGLHPEGEVAIVVGTVANASLLWPQAPKAMSEAVVILHNLMRDELDALAGYEASSDTESFTAVFQRPDDAARFVVNVMRRMPEQGWPEELEDMPECRTVSVGSTVVHRGLRVRFGAHVGDVPSHVNAAGHFEYYGVELARTRRLASMAHEDEALVTLNIVNSASANGVSLHPIGVLSTGIGDVEAFRLLPKTFAPLRVFDDDDYAYIGDVLDVHRCVQDYKNAALPPLQNVAIVVTDVDGSHDLWECEPDAMNQAILLHNRVVREALAEFSGYEVKTELDAFLLAFADVTTAMGFCLAVQQRLVEVSWPTSILGYPTTMSNTSGLWNGLRVKIGVNFGNPARVVHPSNSKAEYFGPVVAAAARACTRAAGGQILVTAQVREQILDAESCGLSVEWQEVGIIAGRGVGAHRMYSCMPVSLMGRHFMPLRDVAIFIDKQVRQITAFNHETQAMRTLQSAESALMEMHDGRLQRKRRSSGNSSEDGINQAETEEELFESLERFKRLQATQQRLYADARIGMVSSRLSNNSASYPSAAASSPVESGAMDGANAFISVGDASPTLTQSSRRASTKARPPAMSHLAVTSPPSEGLSSQRGNRKLRGGSTTTVGVDPFHKSSNLHALSGLLVTHQKLSRLVQHHHKVVTALNDDAVGVQARKSLLDAFIPQIVMTTDPSSRVSCPTETAASLVEISRWIVPYDRAANMSRSHAKTGPKLLKSILAMTTGMLIGFKDYAATHRSKSLVNGRSPSRSGLEDVIGNMFEPTLPATAMMGNRRSTVSSRRSSTESHTRSPLVSPSTTCITSPPATTKTETQHIAPSSRRGSQPTQPRNTPRTISFGAAVKVTTFIGRVRKKGALRRAQSKAT
eukprot:PhM_4_TR10766/c0_g1_i1/m.5621